MLQSTVIASMSTLTSELQMTSKTPENNFTEPENGHDMAEELDSSLPDLEPSYYNRKIV